MPDTGPTFSRLRVGEVFRTSIQSQDWNRQPIGNPSLGDIEVADSSTDVITISNQTTDVVAGTSAADVTAVGIGTRSLHLTASFVSPLDQEVTVIDANALVVVEGGNEVTVVQRTVADGDTISIPVSVRLVDVRHSPGLGGEPVYVGSDFFWQKDASVGSHYLKFDNDPGGAHTEDDTGTVQSVAVLIESLSTAGVGAPADFKVNVSAKNETGDTLATSFVVRLRQAVTYGPWSFTAVTTVP